MKTIIYLAVFALVIAAAILGLSYVFDGITMEQLTDYSIKIGGAIVILTAAAVIVKMLVKGNSQTPSQPGM
jgi:hypothetical protein